MNLGDVNTCYPAKVVSFDPVTGTVQCKLSIESYTVDLTESYTKREAPLLIDVPLFVYQGDGWSLTFPVAAGDDCLVLFTQRGYDHWLYDNKQETGLLHGIPAPDHYRAFEIEDAICLVGIKPIPAAIKDYSPTDVELRNTDRNQRITLKANGDIEVNSPTHCTINAPKATVNCEESEVNASKSAKIVSPKVNVESTTAVVKGTDVTVDCPLTKFTGSIKVAGGISMGGGAKSAVCELNGTLMLNGTGTSTGDFIAAGKSVSTHTHVGNMGKPTSTPQ